MSHQIWAPGFCIVKANLSLSKPKHCFPDLYFCLAVTARRKLKSALELCVDELLEIFLMLLIGPLGLMLHNIYSAKHPTLYPILPPLNIFRHGATKTQILSNHSDTIYDAIQEGKFG